MLGWLLEINDDGPEYLIIGSSTIDYIMTGNRTDDFIRNYIEYTGVNETQALEETLCDIFEERKLISVPQVVNGKSSKFCRDLQSIQNFVIMNKIELIGKIKGSF